ncbi:MAG: trigger factor [Planctomycetota bacterium]
MSTSVDPETAADQDASEAPTLQLEMTVEAPQSCLRDVVVTIPPSEVQRYLKEAYDELVPEAQVPGFRAGRAPRKLVEKQFKDRVKDRVKGSLLMDSLSQVTEKAEFSAIGEPDFEYESIDLPDEGEFKFQFQIEVRPEFATPDWKGIPLVKPVEEITDEDVSAATKRVLARYATMEASDEPAEMGDKLLMTAKFLDGDTVVSEMDEERVTLSEKLSFSDANCVEFGSVMTGAKEGDTRTAKVEMMAEHADEAMSGKELAGEFHVVEVLKQELPELTEDLLDELGEFDSKDEFDEFVRNSLERQANYRTEQAVRGNVVEQLLKDADFELPPALVRRQNRRELDRKVLDLRRSGFDEEMIRRFVNANRQNMMASTESALREHFILEQIAEQAEVDAEPSEYDAEIELIAEQSDSTVRRVRARLEKSGQMDALRNQIIERKVIEMISNAANVTEEPVEKETPPQHEEFAVFYDVVATKDTDAIPEAKYDDNTPKGGQPGDLPAIKESAPKEKDQDED